MQRSEHIHFTSQQKIFVISSYVAMNLKQYIFFLVFIEVLIVIVLNMLNNLNIKVNHEYPYSSTAEWFMDVWIWIRSITIIMNEK